MIHIFVLLSSTCMYNHTCTYLVNTAYFLYCIHSDLLILKKHSIPIKKHTVWGWIEGSAVKGSCSSCKGSKFSFQHTRSAAHNHL